MTPRKKKQLCFPLQGSLFPHKVDSDGTHVCLLVVQPFAPGHLFFIPSRSPTAPRYEPVQNKGGGDITLSRAIGKRELGWFFDHGSFFFTLGKETSPSPLPPLFSAPAACHSLVTPRND